MNGLPETFSIREALDILGWQRIVNFRLWSPSEARAAFLLRYSQLTRASAVVRESTKMEGHN